MLPLPFVCACSFLLLSMSSGAQSGGSPPAPAPAPAAPAGDDLRKAFVAADGGRRLALGAAAEQVLAADQAGRAAFLATIRAIAAVAPPPAAAGTAPAPAAGTTPAAGTAPPKPPQFPAEIVQRMTVAVGPEAAARQENLAKLAADPAHGGAALAQLDARGKLILARCVSTVLRRQMDTNAIYAGQYKELRDFHPESSELLLRWAKEAPRETINPEAFRTACVRALRDTLTAAEATDRVRADLQEVVRKAQATRSQDLFLTAVCALQDYGDATLFERIEQEVRKQAEAEDGEAKVQAMRTLAELNYQARRYEQAATHYCACVAAMEAHPGPELVTLTYNTACSLALAGKTDDAFAYLEKAFGLGAKLAQPLRKALVDSDHDLASLRTDPRFAPLYEKHFGKGSQPGK